MISLLLTLVTALPQTCVITKIYLYWDIPYMSNHLRGKTFVVFLDFC